jgi:hypothetical protein
MMDDRTVDKPFRVGTFDTVAQAERAVRSLLAAGFTKDQLAVICSDKSKEQFFANLPAPEVAGPHTGASVVAGGAIGATVGGALLSATALVTGGAALLAAGTVLVLTGGVLTGAFAADHFAGLALTDYYDQAVQCGKILVAVKIEDEEQAPRLAEAARILAAAGTDDNDDLRAEGKSDQTIGKVKQIAEKAIDKVEQAVKTVRE